ncbi:winged helix-turn-helix domain-containing protein [Halomonas sp. V046]|uniref:winged helix-turn-helix domain-containing protein n=1 Tax=Halomonas sp. V046 TaxID=3459611 RepID=UPI004044D08B
MTTSNHPPLSKTRTSFYRRLYVAHLVAEGIASVPAITAATGMPRRTAQDTLAALEELDIRCRFHAEPGQRHNIGHYRIDDWGPIDPHWVALHHDMLRQALGYPRLDPEFDG